MARYQQFDTASVIEVDAGTVIAAIKEHDQWAGEYKVLLSVDEAVFVVAELSKFIVETQEREKVWNE